MKHTLARILAFALLLPLALALGSCAPATNDNNTPPTDGDKQPPNTEQTPENDPTPPADDGYAETQNAITDYLNVFGRTPVQNDKLAMFWTNSGFSFAFSGTGVTAKIETSSINATYYGYLNVYVDGSATPTNTLCIDKNGTYTLAKDLPAGNHTIEVRKRNEATYGDSATLFLQKLTVTDGKFCKTPPAAPEYIIEFIGDSITSGFGNMVLDGGGAGANFSTHTQDGTMTYATIASRANDANASVLSRSGICYVTGSDRDSMYPYYTQTADLPVRGVDTSYWDFDANPVDVVVINLGTNDTGARIDSKPITAAQYQELAVNFLTLVRVNNPDADIVWAYGMMTQSGGSAIKAAVKQLNDAGDNDIYYCELPTMNTASEVVGVHGHPDYLSHLIAAVTLANFLDDNVSLDLDHTSTLRDAVSIAQQYLDEDDEVLQQAHELLEDGCSSDAALEQVQVIIDACKAAFKAK